MYCAKCGKKLSEGKEFCNYCGTKITNTSVDENLDGKDYLEEIVLTGKMVSHDFDKTEILIPVNIRREPLPSDFFEEEKNPSQNLNDEEIKTITGCIEQELDYMKHYEKDAEKDVETKKSFPLKGIIITGFIIVIACVIGFVLSNKDDGSTTKEKEPVAFEVVSSPTDLEEYGTISVDQVFATSTIELKKYDNSPQTLIDNDTNTSWQEGAEGAGIGEKINLEFEEEHTIKYIKFHLGNWKTEEYYWENNRPKVLDIEINGETYTVSFEDKKEVQWVKISGECVTDEINITIKEVYHGEKWNDTAIAGIEFIGQ